MKTAELEKALAANRLILRRTQYVIRSRTARGWQGRPKAVLDCGHKWDVYEQDTGKSVVSRPTPAQVLKWIREYRPEALQPTPKPNTKTP